MVRKLAEMSETEQKQYRNWRSILDNPLATAEELKNARIKIDALEWKGHSGPLLEMISQLTKRLDLVEECGQSVTDDDRKALLALRKTVELFDADRFDDIERAVEVNIESIAELKTTESQHHNDNQMGWSKHEAAILEARKGRQEITTHINDAVARFDEKFRELEKQQAEIRRDLNTLIADAIDEAKTAIMAEAEAAALVAVGNLIGDSSTTGE